MLQKMIMGSSDSGGDEIVHTVQLLSQGTDVTVEVGHEPTNIYIWGYDNSLGWWVTLKLGSSYFEKWNSINWRSASGSGVVAITPISNGFKVKPISSQTVNKEVYWACD